MKQRAALAGKLHSLRRDLCVRFAASSALRLAAQCAAAFGACFFLAGVRLLSRSVPAALALLAAGCTLHMRLRNRFIDQL